MPQPLPPVAASREQVLGELVGLHARVLRHMPWIQAALVAGFAVVIGPGTPTLLFLVWAGVTLLVESGRALYADRLLRHIERVDPYREHARMVVLAIVSGASEGLSAILFFPQLQIDDQAFLGVALFVIPAGGAVVSMSSRYIIGAYSAAVLLPATITWGLLHPHQFWGVQLMGLLYTGLLVLIAIQAERLLLRSLSIRHERDQVVRDLERLNAEVREAMGRAEQAAAARARVLATASHDLRQPLHALSIYSAILAARPTEKTLEEVGRNIDQIVRSLGSLLTGLLDLSRLSAGHYVSHRQPFALDQLLAGICDEYDSAALARGLALRRNLPPVPVEGDAMAVARIVRNLLDNAVKYTDAGEVCVRCTARGEDAVVSVHDTGRGIAAIEHERVFEEFYQTDNPGRDRGKGVGLGLAIVQRLAELVGAQISLESSPGAGSRFTLVLPRALALSVQPPAAAPPQRQTSLAGHRVYVLDDEHDILKSMQTLLALWQIDAHGAADGMALQALFARLGAPDLLIADLRLGHRDHGDHGARVARELQRTYGPFAVLIITGETSSEALQGANQAGYPVLQKPIAAERLHEAIVESLAGSATAAA